MADCFTMPNAAELVKQLKGRSACVGFYDNCNNCDVEFKTSCRTQQEMNKQAAYAIEALMQENAKLKAKRDAAVADLKSAADASGECFGCKFMDLRKHTCTHQEKMICDKNNSKWEWRGIEENADGQA